MSDEYALTTTDNPWNPWTQFEEWLAYDMLMGYNTLGLVARYAKTSNTYPEEFNNEIINDAQMTVLFWFPYYTRIKNANT